MLHSLPRAIVGAALVTWACACVVPEAPPRPVQEQNNALLAVDPPLFTAYFGNADFDGDAALAQAQPEFMFNGVRGPLSELDGESREIDLEQPSDWVVLHNFSYPADFTSPWYLLTLQAGTPGLSGRVTVRGTREPATVVIGYDVYFSGFYPLPGFQEVPDVQMHWLSAAPGTPREVRYLDR